MWELNASARASHLFISLLYIICLHVTASVTENNTHIYHRLFPRRALLEGSTFLRFTKKLAFVTNSHKDKYRIGTDVIRCVNAVYVLLWPLP